MTFACAHRGLSADKPENSLAAFGAAVAAGFPALEMDLRATKDGECVILHDPDLRRTHGSPLRAHEATYAQLAAIEAGPPPRLTDLFAMLKAWDGLYNLELKVAAAASPAAAAVRRWGLESRVQFSSMVPAALQAARTEMEATPRGFIPFGPVEDGDLDAAKAAACTWINVDHDYVDTVDDVAALREAGFRVAAWTVNDAARARELAGFGVECVITDAADVGRQFPGSVASF